MARFAELPDGTTLEFPDGTEDSVIDSVVRDLLASMETPEAGFGEAVARPAASSLIQNIMGLPDLALAAGSRMLTGAPIFGSETMPFQPALGEKILPLPSGEQVVAGAETAAQLPGAMFRGEAMDIPGRFQERQERAVTVAEQRPGATMTGEVGGDIASILMGRGGIRGMMNRLSRGKEIPAIQALPPGGLKMLDDLVQGVLKTHLPRGVARAAETGFESAMLAALDDGDPSQAAAMAAGSQAGGSLILTLAKPFVSSKPRMFMSLAGATLAFQLAKNVIPGGADDLGESAESAIFKIIPTAILATLAAAAGFGRVPGGSSVGKNLPKIADALTAIPRTAITSLIADFTEDEETGTDQTSRVMSRFIEDPEFFGANAVAIQDAFLNGQARETINTLIGESEEFAQQVFGLGPPTTFTPGRRAPGHVAGLLP